MRPGVRDERGRREVEKGIESRDRDLIVAMSPGEVEGRSKVRSAHTRVLAIRGSK